MTKRASGLSKFLAASAMTLSLGGLAVAGPPRPEFRVDGSVKVAGQVFASAAEWARSDLFRTSGARCGSEDTLPHQELISPTDCSFDHTTINPEYNDNRTLVIQVVFHIIKQNATVGDIPPALLESQIDILNEDYLAIAGTPGAPGANTKIEFVLAKFDPTGAPTPGYEVISNHPEWFQDPDTSPSPMKVALNWDPARYLNVYTNDAAGYLGYATFPFDEAGTVDDGIVVLWNSVGRNAPYGPPYDQGRTLTHEVGHYLGLMHTFQQDPGDTCGTGYDAGDRVADTNTESGQTFGCPIGATSCGVAKPIENYMDYTDDTCMSKFSVEQANRIRCSLINYRTINTKPSADFTFSDDLLAVTFTNTSTDAETALAQLHHAWDFGDGQTSTEASPVHTYATAGTYTVTLTVVDSGSGDSTAMNSVMVVDMPRPPDADPSQPDSDPGNPGDDDGNGGGGCCQTQGGDVSYVLCGIPVLLVLRRRRRQ